MPKPVQDVPFVDDMGLPALVVAGGRIRATQEAAELLELDPKTKPSELMRMFGLHVDPTAANPICRAVRAGCIVSDRMVITDGAGRTRLLEVTTLPAKSQAGVMVILLRAERPVTQRPKPAAKPDEPLRVTVAVAGRQRARGLAPGLRDVVGRVRR